MHREATFQLDCSAVGNVAGPFDVAEFDLLNAYFTSIGSTALSTGVVEIVGAVAGSAPSTLPAGSSTISAQGWKYDVDVSNVSRVYFTVTTAQASTKVTIDCYASNLYVKE